MPKQKFVGPLKLTEKYLKDRSIEVGDCWEWTMAVDAEGYPIMRRASANNTVRRVMFTEIINKPIRPRQPVVMKCSNRVCVNPAHCASSTTSAVAYQAASEGKFSSLTRRVAIARHARVRLGKLDMDAAREIRLSNDSRQELADRFGVGKSAISKVVLNKSWQEYANPFAGLL